MNTWMLSGSLFLNTMISPRWSPGFNLVHQGFIPMFIGESLKLWLFCENSAGLNPQNGWLVKRFGRNYTFVWCKGYPVEECSWWMYTSQKNILDIFNVKLPANREQFYEGFIQGVAIAFHGSEDTSEGLVSNMFVLELQGHLPFKARL